MAIGYVPTKRCKHMPNGRQICQHRRSQSLLTCSIVRFILSSRLFTNTAHLKSYWGPSHFLTSPMRRRYHRSDVTIYRRHYPTNVISLFLRQACRTGTRVTCVSSPASNRRQRRPNRRPRPAPRHGDNSADSEAGINSFPR